MPFMRNAEISKFMDRILDGSPVIDSSHWIDLNCYSTLVSGNPHLMLINQLRSEQRSGKLEAPYRSGGDNNYIYMFTSANHIGTSSTAPYHNNFYSNQAFKMVGQGSSSVFRGHNINGGQVTDHIRFGHKQQQEQEKQQHIHLGHHQRQLRLGHLQQQQQQQLHLSHHQHQQQLRLGHYHPQQQ